MYWVKVHYIYHQILFSYKILKYKRYTTLLNESHPVHSMEHSIRHHFRQNVPIDLLFASKAR